ncbi:hypothetical protein TWF481_010486 [Arthrobotrys musiformis]|uniref:SET domain-containing protein n=1 Tax=Arthrobotrys musiformis TaxID=47236 RepID=A0AAV9W2S6_9PEZI
MSKPATAPMEKSRMEILKSVTDYFDRISKASAKRQGQRNNVTSRDAVIEQYQQLHAAEADAYQLEGVARFILPEPYEPSNPSTSIDRLRKIQVRDLIIGRRHKGCYLKIRIADIARRHESAVDVIFEDEGGSYGILRVYFIHEKEMPGDLLSLGQVIIIREPYFWDSGHEVVFVRVDHHSDIQPVHNWDLTTERYVPLMWRNSTPLKDMGIHRLIGLAELFYEEEDWLASLEKFDWAFNYVLHQVGLESLDERTLIDLLLRLYMGRSDVFMKLRRYYATAGDIDAYLNLVPQDPQARHIRALRFYYAGKYETCYEEAKRLEIQFPQQLAYVNLRRRAQVRFEEMKYGNYDWKTMRQKAATRCIDLDYAEFSHPVKLKKTPKGRRIFTTRDVKRGDVLMVSKAIAMVPFEDSNMCVQLAPRNGKFECEFGCSATFDAEIVERIKREGPEWYERTICLMDDGGQPPSPHRNPDGLKVVDSFHLEAVRRQNSITVSTLPLAQHRTTGYMTCASPHVPRNLTYNCGMWFLPSFLRHSCVPNAHRAVIGDMLVVRAGKDIPKDTKVTISYSTPSNWEYPMTEIACTCRVHEHDLVLTGDPDDPENRAKLKASIWREFNTTCQYIESARSKPEKWTKVNLLDLLLSMMASLDKARPSLPPPQEVPQVQLAHRYRYVAAAYFGAGQRRHARCAYYKVLDCLAVEFVILEQFDEVIWTNHGQCTEDLVHVYNDLSVLATTPGIKRCWREAAMDTYEILFGERLSFHTVMQELTFIELNDKCKCIGVDNLMDADESQMRERLDFDVQKERELRSTVDGLAMMQILDDGAERARIRMLGKRRDEFVIGPENLAVDIKKREKEMERKMKEMEELEAEEKKLQDEKEDEKKPVGKKDEKKSVGGKEEKKPVGKKDEKKPVGGKDEKRVTGGKDNKKATSGKGKKK